MSRIADRKIDLNGLDNCRIDEGCYFSFSYKSKEYSYRLPSVLQIRLDNDRLSVLFDKCRKKSSSIAGLHNALLYNFIHGLRAGFTKRMIVSGVGYKVNVGKDFLNLQVGFSHFIRFIIPNGITIDMVDSFKKKGDIIFDIKGSNKMEVGLFAAQIKAVSPIEPYKLKGIRIDGDYIFQKSGKSKK